MRIGLGAILKRTGVAVCLHVLAGGAIAQVEGWDVDRLSREPYAMTVSGGISRGVYEAGVNEAVVEMLRAGNIESGGERFRLVAATGASAGGLNAFISALRFCESGAHGFEGNFGDLFSQAWDIQLDSLLPRRRSDYELLELRQGSFSPRRMRLGDSVLSRSPFLNTTRRLAEMIRQPRFRTGCRVSVALMVTKTVPELIDTRTAPIAGRSPVQRFVIPIVVRTRATTDGGHGYVEFASPDLRDRKLTSDLYHHLLLPESRDGIDLDDIIRAVLASAAFPLAFSQVAVTYCIADAAALGKETAACPEGYRKDTGKFIDGGLFDNVPMGAAVELLEHSQGASDIPGNYIYIGTGRDDPYETVPIGSTDGTRIEALTSQLGSVVRSVDTLRQQRLNDALLRLFADNPDRQFLMTRRTSEIVGNQLFGFGAFLDRSFFVNDYAAGLLDGVMNITDYFCGDVSGAAHRTERCPEGKVDAFVANYTWLYPDRRDSSCGRSPDVCGQIGAIVDAADVFGSIAPPPARTVPADVALALGPRSAFRELFDYAGIEGSEEQLESVALALERSKKADFQSFLQHLDTLRGRTDGVFRSLPWEFSTRVEYMISQRDGPWPYDLIAQLVYRLHSVESEAGGDLDKLLAAAWTIAPDPRSFGVGGWKPPSALAYSLFPDYLLVDSFQTGVALGWKYSKPLQELNCNRNRRISWTNLSCSHASLDLGAEFHVRRLANSAGEYNTNGLFLGVNIGRPASYLFSSWGLRVRLNADHPKAEDLVDFGAVFGSDHYTTTELVTRFLGDKFTVSIGWGDNPRSVSGGEASLRVGLTNLDKFLLMIPFLN